MNNRQNNRRGAAQKVPMQLCRPVNLKIHGGIFFGGN